MPLLAEFDIESLFRLGFVVLVVFGSAIAGLIKKLGDKRAKQAEDTLTPGAGKPSARQPERSQPGQPAAQAMLPRSQVAPSTPPPAQAWQSRTASAPPQAAESSPRAHPQQFRPVQPPRSQPARAPLIQREQQAPPRRPALPTARPVSRRPRSPAELQAERAGVSRKRRARPVAQRKAKPTKAGKVEKPKKRTLEQEMRARDAAVAIVAEEIGDGIDLIHHPTRASLRRAILLNEVLSPPLALRSPEEAV